MKLPGNNLYPKSKGDHVAAREIKGEIGMGIKGWYMAEDDSAGRSMTVENNYREVAAKQAQDAERPQNLQAVTRNLMPLITTFRPE